MHSQHDKSDFKNLNSTCSIFCLLPFIIFNVAVTFFDKCVAQNFVSQKLFNSSFSQTLYLTYLENTGLQGDEEVFQVKKPSHSKRIVKQLKKENYKDKDDGVSAVVKFDVSCDPTPIKVSLHTMHFS